MGPWYYEVVSFDGDYVNLRRTDIASDELNRWRWHCCRRRSRSAARSSVNTSSTRSSAEHRKPPGTLASRSGRSFLVAVAAILPDEPILAQALGFLHTAADAVEQRTVERAVGVADLGHPVAISEFFTAFLSGHQIKLFHSAAVSSFLFLCAHTPRSIVALPAAGRYSPIPQKEARIFGASSS